MGQAASLTVILMSTATIAVVHSLAPDHWVPFVSIGRARKWSTSRMASITLLAGIGHVGTSVLIGAVGMVLGFSLTGLESIEGNRGAVAGLLLIGFGLAYAIWGLKQLRSHAHSETDVAKSTAVWTLIAIFVLGPCEPLIPLMFISAAHGWSAVLVVSALFGAITIVMMIGQALIVYLGLDMFRVGRRINHHHSHIIAGLVIAATGAGVMFLGI